MNIVTGRDMPVLFLADDTSASEYFLNARLASPDCEMDRNIAKNFNLSLSNKGLVLNDDDVIQIAEVLLNFLSCLS